NRFLHVGVNSGDGCANAPIGIANLIAENESRVDDDWKHSQRDERQLPIHVQHDADNSEEHEHVLEDRHYPGGEHFIQSIDISRDAGHEAAHGILVEKCYMHVLKMSEDLAAQIEHHFLPGPLHGVGLDELEH